MLSSKQLSSGACRREVEQAHRVPRADACRVLGRKAEVLERAVGRVRFPERGVGAKEDPLGAEEVDRRPQSRRSRRDRVGVQTAKGLERRRLESAAGSEPSSLVVDPAGEVGNQAACVSDDQLEIGMAVVQPLVDKA